MMKEMLKYQQIDLQIQNLQAELSANKDRKGAVRTRSAIDKLQGQYAELEDRCKQALTAYKQYQSIYGNMAKNLELIEKNIDTDNASKIDGLIEALEAISSNLSTLAKEISNVMALAQNATAEYSEISTKVKALKEEGQRYNAAYQEAKQQMLVRENELRKQLAEQEVKVDKQLLEKYKQKSAEIKKVFVPLTSGTCGGCRIGLSAGKLNLLKSQKFAECENCGRIIYVEN